MARQKILHSLQLGAGVSSCLSPVVWPASSRFFDTPGASPRTGRTAQSAALSHPSDQGQAASRRLQNKTGVVCQPFSEAGGPKTKVVYRGAKLVTFRWEIVPLSPFLSSLGQYARHHVVYRLFSRAFKVSHDQSKDLLPQLGDIGSRFLTTALAIIRHFSKNFSITGGSRDWGFTKWRKTTCLTLSFKAWRT